MADDAAQRRHGAPAWLLDLGCAVTVASLVAFAWPTQGASHTAMQELPFLGLSAHILLSLYHGVFSRRRTITWCVMIVAYSVAVLAGLIGYVLPWEQMYFWLVSVVGNAFPQIWSVGFDLDFYIGAIGTIGAATVVGAVILDVALLHLPRLRRSRFLQGLLAAVALVSVLGLFADIAHVASGPGEPATVPLQALRERKPAATSLAFAPFYAILRVPADKALGTALMFAVMLLPITAPWARGWRFHAPATRTAWAVSVAALAMSWIGLAALGLAAPTPLDRAGTLVLAAYDVASFVVLPFVLGRLAPAPSDRRGLVFD